MKTSVIIPVYNAEKTIKRCLDSIFQQNDIEFEIIVVNDGSNDNSEKIIAEYFGKNNLKYIKQENKGVSSARNEGIRNSTGEYIIFVDADDYLMPDTLKNRISLAQRCDLLISGHIECDYSGTISEKRPSKVDKFIPVLDALWSISPSSDLGYQGFLWNKVFSKKILIENDIHFDNEVFYGEDRLFVGNYLIHCDKILLNPDMVYCYDMISGSAMSGFELINKHNEDKIFTEFKGLEKVEELVTPYDENLVKTFRYYEFCQSIRILKNVDNSTSFLKNHCKSLVRRRMLEILRYPSSIVSVINKLKAIVHCIILR